MEMYVDCRIRNSSMGNGVMMRMERKVEGGEILWNMEWCAVVPRWGGAPVPSPGLNDRQMR